jgi:hypothetical protein
MTDGSRALKCRFSVRPDYPLWTNRKIINGVVSGSEDLIGDAILEDVIGGVMDDIRVWADANSVSDIGTWTSLGMVPIAIMRATTYGVVAALYARKTRTFQGKVIPTVAPVAIHVMGDEEKAMRYWIDKQKEMLNLYYAIISGARVLTSTADQEPVFSMNDIVPPPSNDVAWQDWLVANGEMRLVGSGGNDGGNIPAGGEAPVGDEDE